MRCPYCGFLDSRVLDKRETADLSVTRRRRECLGCHKRFSTHERIETIDLLIVKKDSRLEPYSSEKLRLGLFKAFEKRPVSSDVINSIVAEIEQDLRVRPSSEVEAKYIGQLVMKKLKKIDHVAYIRFASVYRNFTEVKDFEQALKALVPERSKHEA